MKIDSRSVFRSASIVWQPFAGVYICALIVKATFRLRSGQCELASLGEQEEIAAADHYWDDDSNRSLYIPCEIVPFKAHTDVLLVGYAYAPPKKPARSLIARLRIGPIDKSIEIVGESYWTLHGELREGIPFQRMPLRYERAAGGADNPVGIRSDSPPDAESRYSIPNLRPPGLRPSSRADIIPAVGFGPIAPTWPERIKKIAHLSHQWTENQWSKTPMPTGFTAGFFNSAPADQQMPSLSPNEPFELENLMPDTPKLRTALPGISPKAVAEWPDRKEEIRLIADTLWIDTDRSICTVIWRGPLRLPDKAEPNRIVIEMERRTKPPLEAASAVSPGPVTDNIPISVVEFDDLDPDTEMGMKTSPLTDALREQLPGGPALSARTPYRGDGTLRGTVNRGPVLPFQKPTEGAPPPPAAIPSPNPPPPRPSSPGLGDSAIQTLVLPLQPKPAAPETADIPKPAPLGPIAAPAHQVSLAEAKMPGAREPGWIAKQSEKNDSSPWDKARPSPVPEPPRISVTSGASAHVAAPSAAPKPDIAPIDALKAVKPLNALSASNAAAGALKAQAGTPSSAPMPEPLNNAADNRARATIELLWYNPNVLPRLRRHKDWREILKTLRKTPLKLTLREAADEALKRHKRDRRDMAAILTMVSPCGEGMIGEVMRKAVDETGMFTPPLVMLGGEIEFQFDEMEILKITLAVAKPWAGKPNKLKDAVEALSEFIHTPRIGGSAGLGARLAARVGETFAEAHKQMPSNYVEAETERYMLEKRLFQKKSLLGRSFLQARMHLPDTPRPIPIYLPEEILPLLPMLRRFAARIVGEARPRLDQYEEHERAICAMVLGRELPWMG